MLRRNIWSAFQTCIALLTVSFKSTTSLERLVVKVQKITFMFQSKKTLKHRYKKKYVFTSSSKWDIGTSVVFLLGDRPRPIAGPDMVMDFTGSGGGLFPPVLGTTELKHQRKAQGS